jgi:hypothetical protein
VLKAPLDLKVLKVFRATRALRVVKVLLGKMALPVLRALQVLLALPVLKALLGKMALPAPKVRLEIQVPMAAMVVMVKWVLQGYQHQRLCHFQCLCQCLAHGARHLEVL